MKMTGAYCHSMIKHLNSFFLKKALKIVDTLAGLELYFMGGISTCYLLVAQCYPYFNGKRKRIR